MPLHIVLDTNVIEGNHNPESMDWELFREWRALSGACVCIPEVVHFEIRKHFLKNQVNRIQKLVHYACERVKLWDVPLIPSPFESTDSKVLEEKLRKELDERVDGALENLYIRLFGVEPTKLGWPSISHKELLKSYYLQEQKPYFGDDKRSYQDTILWESILDLFRAGVEKVVFVSNNKADFFASKDNANGDQALLHPHLRNAVSEILQASNLGAGVELFDSLSTLVSRKHTSSWLVDKDAVTVFAVQKLNILQGSLKERRKDILRGVHESLRSYFLENKHFILVPDWCELSDLFVQSVRTDSDALLLNVSEVKRPESGDEALLKGSAVELFKIDFVLKCTIRATGQMIEIKTKHRFALKLFLLMFMNHREGGISNLRVESIERDDLVPIELQLDRVVGTFDVSVLDKRTEDLLPREKMKECDNSKVIQIARFIGTIFDGPELDRTIALRHPCLCAESVLNHLFPEMKQTKERDLLLP